MPELPEVEAIARRLRPEAVGAVIKRIEVLRARSTAPQKPSVLQKAVGKRIESIERRGKNLVLRLSGDLAIRVHLRMSGILHAIPDARLYTASTRVLFTLKGGSGIAFEDRRVLGTVHLHSTKEVDEKLRRIGPEPLTKSFTAKYLTDVASRSIRPIKIFLMDQHVIAGLGNIYAAEALFEAKIHPAVPAKRIPKTDCETCMPASARFLNGRFAMRRELSRLQIVMKVCGSKSTAEKESPVQYAERVLKP